MKQTILCAMLLLGAMSFVPQQAEAQKMKLATLSRAYKNGQPVGKATVFKPGDRELHCVVLLDKGYNTTLRSLWTAVNAQGLPKNMKVYDDKTRPGFYDRGHFSVSIPQDWPRGQYKVDIFAGAKLIRSIAYLVK